MDAVEFLKAERRICEKNNCTNCPLSKKDTLYDNCKEFKVVEPEKYVSIVEQWAVANPIMTNKEKFHEVFGDNIVFHDNECNLSDCYSNDNNNDDNLPCWNCDWWNEEYNETKRKIGF